MGHYASQCPHKLENTKKKKNHAHTIEYQEHKDEDFVFILALTGTINQGSDTWIIDSGASKSMTGSRISLSNLTKMSSSLQVDLGDNSKHWVKGIGKYSLQFDSGNHVLIKDIFFVQNLNKNLLSISSL